MKKTLALLILLSGFLSCGANILRVALDGSQPYTVIQEAINSSANTDTVLVYQGRYYENIRFYGKNITLASLELITGDMVYKHNTILDGNQNGSVIQIGNGESNATIRGMTITNGSGFYDSNYDETFGGGVLIGALNQVNDIKIINCIITRNYAGSGGGIQVGRCNMFLSGTSIRENNAESGGGIKASYSFTTQYSTTFDPVNRCSIYNNKAAFGCEMYFYLANQIHVVVDTFTVANPSNFYASAIPQDSNIENPYTFDILNSVHTEVNNDLFVAPWGDDASDGLTEGTPLQTIFRAVYNIESDPDNPKTIHLAEGCYAKSRNQQFFPIPMKNYTRMKGRATDRVILDMEMHTFAMSICPFSKNVAVSDITFQNGKGGIGSSHSDGIMMQNIAIRDISHILSTSGYVGYQNANQSLINMSISNGYAGSSFDGIDTRLRNGTLYIKNLDLSMLSSLGDLRSLGINAEGNSEAFIDGLVVHDNQSSGSDMFNSVFQIAPLSDYCQRFRVELSNSSFYSNQQANPNCLAHIYAKNDTTFIRNCTFANNRGGSSALMVKGNAVFENNVFWNPLLPKEVTAYYSASEGISGRVEFDNNCIRNGLNGIYNMSPLNEIIWHDSNISDDPLFELQGNHPYRLSSLSSLIDSGLQSVFSEPGTDAGGNERIWDGNGDGIAVIDIGAYEYQPIFSPTNLTAQLWQQQIELNWDLPVVDRSLSGYRIYRNNLPHAELSDPSLRQFRDYSPVNDTLSYYVVALYGSVESQASNTVTVIVSGVDNADETLVPVALNLTISPNPFSDIAVIRYNLSKTAKVKLQIYNLKGQLVRTVISETQSKGEQLAVWEGCDQAGRHLASGIYFLSLSIDGKQGKPRRLVLLK